MNTQVTDDNQANDDLHITKLQRACLSFKGGQVQHFISNWETLTSDPFILDAIKHYHIEFEADCPVKPETTHSIQFSEQENEIIESEIEKYLAKEIIEKACVTDDCFISNIFVRPKKDGSHRMILNLKNFNHFVDYHHFKMDTFKTAISLIRPGCFMASIDLKDAYYSIPIAQEDRRFLMFEWKGTYYQFTSLPNGLSSAPRLFTKILKPVYSHLRELGHTCMGHIDDSLLVGYNYQSCKCNITDSLLLFTQLGFVIHPEKSVLQPVQSIEFLGFVIDSVQMTTRLLPRKVTKVKSICNDLLHKHNPTIREVAQVIGLLVSSLPGALFGPLHYRHLERDKITALKNNKGNFDSIMSLSRLSKQELMWWLNNIDSTYKPISHDSPTVIIATDASTVGWGAVMGNLKAGGPWDQSEQQSHINCLEMKAVLLGLKSLCKNHPKQHIQIQCDNTTAITYINSMGGVKSLQCDILAREIWEWCIQREIWISACHIPGSQNIEADKESRVFNLSTEWSLSLPVFHDISNKWGPFDIDLFASRLNYKVDCYVSWRPDPKAKFIDAFYMQWQAYLFYAFPPFSVISTCLQKITKEQATGVLVVPLWRTQPWFTVVLNILVDTPLILPQSDTLLTQPHSGDVHPLRRQLQLMAIKVSGKPSLREEFQAKLLPLSPSHGPLAPKNNISPILKSGTNFVLNGKLIPTIHL